MTGLIDGIVHVLVIDHRHGTDYSVHATQAGAYGELAAYCREWWSETRLDEPPPDNDTSTVQTCFDAMEDERWEIGVRQIAG